MYINVDKNSRQYEPRSLNKVLITIGGRSTRL